MPILGIGIHEYTYIYSVRVAPPEEASLIIYQWPILIVVFIALIDKKKLKRKEVLGCLISMLGVLILFIKGVNFFSDIIFNEGHFFALLSAFLWSSYSALITKWAEHSNKLLFFNFLVMGIVSSIISLSVESSQNVSISSLGFLCVYGLLIAGAYIAWDLAMKEPNRQLVAQMATAIPMLTIVWLISFGKSELSINLIISMFLITLGILETQIGLTEQLKYKIKMMYLKKQ